METKKTARKPYPVDIVVQNDIKEIYGPFAAKHHARYHEAQTPYHLITRTFQGLALMTPTAAFTDIVAGVFGRALTIYPGVTLYAWALLNNHLHLCGQGGPDQIPAFMAYVKREISRRWAWEIGWQDTMWSAGYLSTALPTAQSQEACLEYILSQGVKEKITERPQQWRGFHFARAFLDGERVVGRWLNGTTYGKARWKQQQKPVDKRRHIDKAKHTVNYEVPLGTIPAWSGLSAQDLQANKLAMLGRVVQKGEQLRKGAPPLGFGYALRLPRTTRWQMPKPPWFEERRRMICWASPHAEETKAYLLRYWAFQRSYRAASDRCRDGRTGVEFPPGSFLPPRFVRATVSVSPDGANPIPASAA